MIDTLHGRHGVVTGQTTEYSPLTGQAVLRTVTLRPEDGQGDEWSVNEAYILPSAIPLPATRTPSTSDPALTDDEVVPAEEFVEVPPGLTTDRLDLGNARLTRTVGGWFRKTGPGLYEFVTEQPRQQTDDQPRQ